VIVVAGEALIDLIPGPRPGEYRSRCGGGPANTAVQLSRLGLRTALLSRLSQDALGGMLAQWLEREGVELLVSQRTQAPTTLGVANLDDHGAADYRFYWQGTSTVAWTSDDFPPPLPPNVQAVHVGSLATVFQPCAALVNQLVLQAAGTATVCVDANFRPQVDVATSARRRLENWVGVADIVKVSVEDLQFAYTGTDPVEIARNFARHSTTMILLTDGSRGAQLYQGDLHLHACVPAPSVVDTIGAGDSFGAGFLFGLSAQHALLPGPPRPPAVLQAALTVACWVAALSCGRPGADGPQLAELPAEAHDLVTAADLSDHRRT
jgi:fructokinase